MFHSLTSVRGFHLHATDGAIGHVDDFLFDGSLWAIRYLVVDTSNWIGGRSVLVSTGVVTAIDPAERRIHISLTRAQVEEAPALESVEVPLAETRHTIWIM
jgi:hypothetical protein